MKLLFKQKFFSWFDSYDIFNEAGEVCYEVKGQLSWGHCLKVYGKNGEELGTVKEKVLTFLPRFEIYMGDVYVGSISKELTLFKPKYSIDYQNWQVEGDFLSWNYTVTDDSGNLVASVAKEFWNFTDTYSIDVVHEEDALSVLMFVLALDAEKCSSQNN